MGANLPADTIQVPDVTVSGDSVNIAKPAAQTTIQRPEPRAVIVDVPKGTWMPTTVPMLGPARASEDQKVAVENPQYGFKTQSERDEQERKLRGVQTAARPKDQFGTPIVQSQADLTAPPPPSGSQDGQPSVGVPTPAATAARRYGTQLGAYQPAGWYDNLYPLRPGTEAAVQTTKVQQTRGQQKALDIEAEGIRRQQAQLDYFTDRLEDMNRQHEVDEQHRQLRYQDMRKRAEDLSKQATDTKVQPGRIFADQGAGMAIMAAIGGALGGMLQARIGGPNQFMQTLDTMIDRDIRAQQANIDQGLRKADAAREDYNALRTQLGDERLAEEVHRARIGNWVAQRIKSIAMNTDSQAVKQRAKMMEDDLNVWFADRGAQRDLLTRRNAMIVGGRGPAVDPSRVIRLPNGTVHVAPNNEVGNDLNKRAAFYARVHNNDNRALALREEALRAGPQRLLEINRELKSLNDNSMTAISQAGDQGVVRKEDAARMQTGRVPYDSVLPGTSNAIKNMRDYDQKQLETEVRQRAPELGEAGYVLDPMGNIVPRTRFEGQSDQLGPTQMPQGAKQR